MHEAWEYINVTKKNRSYGRMDQDDEESSSSKRLCALHGLALFLPMQEPQLNADSTSTNDGTEEVSDLIHRISRWSNLCWSWSRPKLTRCDVPLQLFLFVFLTVAAMGRC